MAMTENKATAEPTPAAPAVEAAPAVQPVGGLAGMLGTADHKTIGRLYIGFAFLFLALAAVTGGLLGLERTDVATLQILDGDSFDQVFSLHAISSVFLFLLPLLVGIAMVVVPLQVGARTVAFPRAAAASFWLWFLASALVLASYAMNGGVPGGDFDGVTLFFASFAVLTVALCLATMCLVTTVLTLRSTGMTLDRAPLFSWSVVVGGTVWLLTLPVLAGFTVLAYVSYRYGVTTSAASYGHLRWAWEQPQVFAYAVPALGIVAEVVAVFARTRQRRHLEIMVVLALAAVLGIGAWTVVRTDNPRVVEQALYVIVAFAVVVPPLALLGLAGETLFRGRVRLASPLLFGLGGLLMMLAGAGAAALGAIDALDLQFLGENLADTTWTAGVVHYVLIGTVLAALGGLHYWATKLFGRPISEGPARAAALLALLGTIILSLPDLITGALDQFLGRQESVRDGVEALNIVSVIGGGLLVLAAVIVVATLASALSGRGDVEVERDPWEGHTLEWATDSPPPPGNFAEVPVVGSPAPLLDLREESESDG